MAEKSKIKNSADLANELQKNLDEIVEDAIKTLDGYFEKQKKTIEVMNAITAYNDLIFVYDILTKRVDH